MISVASLVSIPEHESSHFHEVALLPVSSSDLNILYERASTRLGARMLKVASQTTEVKSKRPVKVVSNRDERKSSGKDDVCVIKVEEVFPEAPIARKGSSTAKAYRVRVGRPKELHEMLSLSGGGNTRCNKSGQLDVLRALAQDGSDSSTRALERACQAVLPMNYVPFEPLFSGSRESKVKIHTAPALHAKDEPFSFGMRLQTPKPLEEMGVMPRLIGSVRRVKATPAPLPATRRYD